MAVYSVIMAGGKGSRLWPLSTEEKPKQTLRLLGDYTLFQDAVRRIISFTDYDHIIVVASNHHITELKNQVPNIPRANFLVEPTGKGTAPCIGLAAAHLAQKDPESIMVVLTADHYVGDVNGFRKALEIAVKVASKGHLITLGIQPKEPSTGYGYIEQGALLNEIEGHKILRVASFREKPDKEKAEKMVESGDYSWNSGMFIWKVYRILEEFKKHMPAFYKELSKIMDAVDSPDYQEVLEESWFEVSSETIDYGIMEKADDVIVIPVDFGWSDLGSWSSIMELLPSDKQGNVVRGQHLGINTKGSFIMGKDRLIATIGVNDLIIIDSGEALLICNKFQDQKVRDLVKMLSR
jgi:mannose-1-phosphate guanylyltransferase